MADQSSILQIRSEQLDALVAVSIDDFVERARIALGLVAAGLVGSVRARAEAEARARIREGIERARGYDIRTERDVMAYLRVMVRLGEDFDREPWAVEILGGERVNVGMSKAALLERAAGERA